MYKIAMIPVLLLPLTLSAQSGNTTLSPALPTPSSGVTASASAVQPANPAATMRQSGFLSYIDFGGSSNDSGHIFTLGISAGYQFNEHISVNARVPFYFESAPITDTSTTGETQTTTLTDRGIGDPSFALLLSFPNRVLDYKTGVTTWVPIADMNSGFTTGSVLVDWTHHLSRPVGRLRPFSQIDIANTVPDTPLFLLPYTAQGFNARFEGGTKFRITKILSAGGSFYYVLPSGQQHLYSREFHTAGQGGSGGSGTSGGMGGPGAQAHASGNRYGFMTQEVTVGNDLTRDRGFSTWLSAALPHFVDVEIGFTRSYGYDLNTVSFGVGFDPVQALRPRHQ